MRRFVALLLALVLLTLMTPALAAGMAITLTAEEYVLHYAFDAGENDPFVILEYSPRRKRDG